MRNTESNSLFDDDLLYSSKGSHGFFVDDIDFFVIFMAVNYNDIGLLDWIGFLPVGILDWGREMGNGDLEMDFFLMVIKWIFIRTLQRLIIL